MSSLQNMIRPADLSGQKQPAARYSTKATTLPLMRAATPTLSGQFRLTVIYPTVTFDAITLTGHGDYDWFIAKYDTNGSVVWAKNAGGTAGDMAHGVALDNSGNVYVAGFFSGTMTVDGVTVSSTGLYDILLAKNSDGTLVWLKRAGGTGADIAHGIVVDSAGNISIVGEFQNTASFDSNSIVALGLGDAFIAKYDSNGNNLWVRRGGGISITRPIARMQSQLMFQTAFMLLVISRVRRRLMAFRSQAPGRMLPISF